MFNVAAMEKEFRLFVQTNCSTNADPSFHASLKG